MKSLEILNRLLTEYAQELNQPDLRYLYEQAQFSKGIALAQLRRCDEAVDLLITARAFDLRDCNIINITIVGHVNNLMCFSSGA
jgi:Flp pilus assembly protein TadD